MSNIAQAPKLQIFLERRHNQTAVAAPRGDWEALGVSSTNYVAIDVRQTPIAAVAQDSSRVAVVARQTTPSDARVSVYRCDPADPKPWNGDHYSIWLDLWHHADVPALANKASTSLDANLVEYIRENVYWVKEERGDDHWLAPEELPDVVQAIVSARRPST
jgi:hypothetical protein